MFAKNFSRRATALAIQIRLAETPGVSNLAKSSYYRSATILLCTIIEGVVYQLVKKHTHPDYIIGINKEYKTLHIIPKGIFSTKSDIYICERTEKSQHIDDDGVQFGKLNIFLKNKNIISESEFKKLDKVRIERNKVHLQGLSGADTGYTKSKLIKISESLDFLVQKL